MELRFQHLEPPANAIHCTIITCAGVLDIMETRAGERQSTSLALWFRVLGW